MSSFVLALTQYHRHPPPAPPVPHVHVRKLHICIRLPFPESLCNVIMRTHCPARLSDLGGSSVTAESCENTTDNEEGQTDGGHRAPLDCSIKVSVTASAERLSSHFLLSLVEMTAIHGPTQQMKWTNQHSENTMSGWSRHSYNAAAFS